VIRKGQRMILKTRAGEYDLDPEGRINFVNAREVVPGVWVWNIPIRPGETGRVHPCGYWHWHVGFRLRATAGISRSWMTRAGPLS